ncbi:MAG: UDP-N-acetylmuramoyl-L-alanine--D-glutamate ligase [Cytophagales bacterium]|nr:UDP-N-acetylmuramoyl-L-alanine--D-glutamate ligase [Cytophagales bacterium]
MKKKVVILGGAESGVGAAILAKVKGYSVFLSDNGILTASHKQTLREYKIEFEEGQHSPDIIYSADIIVKSPGIPEDLPVVVEAKERNIPVISEIEFAIRHSKAKFIGITGTNGKTTTTLLIHHLLKENEFDVGLAGNVGHSLARMVAEKDRAYFVVELSSFQLDGVYQSRLNVAVLLNITPDHLNRYNNDFRQYVESKFRITRNMRKEDHFIYNESDENIRKRLHKLNSNVGLIPVSSGKTEQAKAYPAGKNLMFKERDSIKRISKSGLPLPGKHNMINVMAAVVAARKIGVGWEGITKALKTFKNVPHRLEYVGDIKNVHFYNDSKATNVDAVWYAIDSFDAPIVLIMGGTDKGNDYSKIDELVIKRVKAIVALGTDNTKIESHFKNYLTDISSTDSAFNAVEIAFSKAGAGDVVLLSPACASFDLFKNYEERGDRFKEAFYALKEKIERNLMMML